MATRNRMVLGDGGTLDTVIVCRVCTQEFRYNFDGDGTYGDFIEFALEDADEQHDDCPRYTVVIPGVPREYRTEWHADDEKTLQRGAFTTVGEAIDWAKRLNGAPYSIRDRNDEIDE